MASGKTRCGGQRQSDDAERMDVAGQLSRLDVHVMANLPLRPHWRVGHRYRQQRRRDALRCSDQRQSPIRYGRRRAAVHLDVTNPTGATSARAASVTCRASRPRRRRDAVRCADPTTLERLHIAGQLSIRYGRMHDCRYVCTAGRSSLPDRSGDEMWRCADPTTPSGCTSHGSFQSGMLYVADNAIVPIRYGPCDIRIVSWIVRCGGRSLLDAGRHLACRGVRRPAR